MYNYLNNKEICIKPNINIFCNFISNTPISRFFIYSYIKKDITVYNNFVYNLYNYYNWSPVRVLWIKLIILL
jgi:hypothetical protein